MDTYTPINKAILTSTIWGEKPHVRVLWLSMLISADRHGRVAGSIPGLARLAVLSLQECEDALGVLLAPDQYSRTKDNDGRRVAEIDGGWQILNHQKHKDLIDRGAQRNRERQAKHRETIALRNAEVTRNNDQNQNQNQNQKEERDLPLPPPGEAQHKLGLDTEPSEWEHRHDHSLPLEQSRMRQNERNEGGELPEGAPTPKTRKRGSQTAKRAKAENRTEHVDEPVDQTSDAHKLKLHYVAQFEFLRGSKLVLPNNQWGRAQGSFKSLTETYGLETAEKIVTAALSSRFCVKVSPWDILSNAANHLGSVPATSQPRVETRPPPPDGKPGWFWETSQGAPHWRWSDILQRNADERAMKAKETE